MKKEKEEVEERKIEDAYNEVRKKYKKLPKFSKINSEFEIYKIEHLGFPLPEVRRRIARIFQACVSNIRPIVSPHPQSLHSLVESGAFSKKEKYEVYRLYKKFWYWVHKGIVDGLGKEQENVDFIVEAWKAWPKMKKKYKKIIKKCVDEWKKRDKFEEEYKNYFG